MTRDGKIGAVRKSVIVNWRKKNKSGSDKRHRDKVRVHTQKFVGVSNGGILKFSLNFHKTFRMDLDSLDIDFDDFPAENGLNLLNAV